MTSRIPLLTVLVTAIVATVACGGGSLSGVQHTTTYTIGGTVSGIPTGASVILQNGSQTLTVSQNGSFTFPKAVDSGTSYNVTVATPPPGDSCSVTNGSGTANANITNITVACTAAASSYTISGTLSGLASGASVVLQDNNSDNLTLTADGNFTFATQIASGAAYSVTVLTQPTGQLCSVANASGTATANVNNVTVTCGASGNNFTIGGTLSGLSSGTVVLENNGADDLSLSANGQFTFLSPIAAGGSYSVTVKTQPAGQNCTVSNGTGTANANVTTVSVACAPVVTTYTISGTLSGLANGVSVVVVDNTTDQLTLTQNGSFTFTNGVAAGGNYSVTVLTQPLSQNCSVTNGTGIANANVTNVQVTCVSDYTIGGTVSGLATGTSVVLADNAPFDSLTVSANGPFTFNRTLAAGSSYAVTVATQPNGQTCTVTAGAGTANADVTNVQVTCVTTVYTVSVAVTGLTGTLVVKNDQNQQLSFSSNTTQQFSEQYAPNATYTVSILTQPNGQTCTLSSNASGTITSNVTVTATCGALTTFTLSVAASGMTAGTLVVQNDQNQQLSFPTNSTQSFSFAYPSGAAYSVSIVTQPAGQTCTLGTNATGNITANTTVSATCSASGNTFTIGGTLYDLSASPSTTGVVIQNNGGDDLSLAANGSFTFSTAVANGSQYNVTVKTNPSSPAQTCTVNNGSGTASANVTDVQVVCIGEWTWVDGANTVKEIGVYPSSKNKPGGMPGSRYDGSQWIDSSGNLWMFGGIGYDNELSGAESNLNDMWKYIQGGTGWEWTAGANSNQQVGIYPTSTGQAGTPGGRSGEVSWQDSAGNFWMFGGYVNDDIGQTADPFNDLWEFSGGQWLWQGGSQTQNQKGTYVGIGQPGTPGARYWGTGAVDSSGNFWMFGGYGLDSSGSGIDGYLNDVWEYVPSTNQWIWQGGSSTAGAKGVYTGSSLTPGARAGAVSWIDSQGNFWLFGGLGVDGNNITGNLNDLWEFNLSTLKWTWVGGSQTNGAVGVYGTQGVPDAGIFLTHAFGQPFSRHPTATFGSSAANIHPEASSTTTSGNTVAANGHSWMASKVKDTRPARTAHWEPHHQATCPAGDSLRTDGWMRAAISGCSVGTDSHRNQARLTR